MAVTPAPAVDISRLLTGLRQARPSGVERLELGYATRLGGGQGMGVALTPIGPRVVSAAARRRIAATAAARWGEDGADESGAEAVLSFLATGERPAFAAPRLARRSLASLLPALARAAFRTPSAALPPGCAYLHANFFRLERPDYFAWTGRRPDIRPVFMLYDMLPLQHPDFFRPGEAALHRARLETAARRGAMLLTSAETVAADLAAHFRAENLPLPPIQAGRLPVDEIFRPAATPAPPPARPFFLVCGTIEPRKNHRLLLAVWDELVAAMGEAAPCLVIAGRRGWRNEEVFARLDDLGPLARHVIEAPALTSAALARLMRQASAVLSPSFAEGYGLPVAEALACGAPAIVADTPVYRELWAGSARLVPPGDVAGWTAAIAAQAAAGPAPGGEEPTTPELNARPAHAMRWPEHIEWIEGLLAQP